MIYAQIKYQSPQVLCLQERYKEKSKLALIPKLVILPNVLESC